uniref:Flagellar FliJ protein n=2 Tax=Caenorhabditis tropicalis TaxID=1561998 RepID=A0A1I7TPG4_9PELO
MFLVYSKAKNKELKARLTELEEKKSMDEKLRNKIQTLKCTEKEAKNETIKALEAKSEIQQAQFKEAMITIKSQAAKLDAIKMKRDSKGKAILKNSFLEFDFNKYY